MSQPTTNHKEGRTDGYETTQKSGNTEGMIASHATTNGKEISNFLFNEHIQQYVHCIYITKYFMKYVFGISKQMMKAMTIIRVLPKAEVKRKWRPVKPHK